MLWETPVRVVCRRPPGMAGGRATPGAVAEMCATGRRDRPLSAIHRPDERSRATKSASAALVLPDRQMPSRSASGPKAAERDIEALLAFARSSCLRCLRDSRGAFDVQDVLIPARAGMRVWAEDLVTFLSRQESHPPAGRDPHQTTSSPKAIRALNTKP